MIITFLIIALAKASFPAFSACSSIDCACTIMVAANIATVKNSFFKQLEN